MTLSIIKRIINNDDISYHIYNLYLIEKYFDDNDINKQINLFLNYFINKKDYWFIILNKIKFKQLSLTSLMKIERLFINDEIIKFILSKNPNIIRILTNKYRNNELIIEKLCYYNSFYFKFASPTLKVNIKFILRLLDINIYVYFYIDDNLKLNKEIIKKIREINPTILLLI